MLDLDGEIVDYTSVVVGAASGGGWLEGRGLDQVGGEIIAGRDGIFAICCLLLEEGRID